MTLIEIFSALEDLHTSYNILRRILQEQIICYGDSKQSEINIPFVAWEGIRAFGQRVFDLVLKEYLTEGKQLEMRQ